MNFTFVPSLDFMSLVKIAVSLWSQYDIKYSLTTGIIFPFNDGEKVKWSDKNFEQIDDLALEKGLQLKRAKWSVIEDKVKEKISQLSLPGALKEKLLIVIKQIGLEISKWKDYHYWECRDLSKISPDELSWTVQGTIDFKKSAKVFINDETFNISDRYRLACIYCLEDDILRLWNKLSDSCKNSFYRAGMERYSGEPEFWGDDYSEESYSEDIATIIIQKKFAIFWAHDLGGKMAKMRRPWRTRCSPYQYAFEYAVSHVNKAAAEYFLQKLTPTEREESLVRSVGYIEIEMDHHDDTADDQYKKYRDWVFRCNFINVLWFLLPQMNEEQQMQVFKEHSCLVLKCLLDWPWQNLFIELANQVWDFLDVDDKTSHLYCLLKAILDKEIKCLNDYNYQKLYKEFWQQSPRSLKRSLIELVYHDYFLSDLFKIEDINKIKLIFKESTHIEKNDLIFSYRGHYIICLDLIQNDKWYLLKFFITECILSVDEMISFKEKFEDHAEMPWFEEKFTRKKDKWDRFIHDLIDEYCKKSVAEAESSPQ